MSSVQTIRFITIILQLFQILSNNKVYINYNRMQSITQKKLHNLYSRLRNVAIETKIGYKKNQNNPILIPNQLRLFPKHMYQKYHRKSKPKISVDQKCKQSNYTFSNIGITTTKLYCKIQQETQQKVKINSLFEKEKYSNQNRKEKLGLSMNYSYLQKQQEPQQNLARCQTVTDWSQRKKQKGKLINRNCSTSLYKKRLKTLETKIPKNQLNGWEISFDEEN